MIKITIRGQLYRDEDSASYSYPLNEDKAWQSCIPYDPRINLQKLGCKQCYAIWHNENGYYYAFYRHLPTRAGADAALIVALSKHVIADGESFVSKLMDILDYCIEQSTSRQISDNVIKEKINDIEKCLSKYEVSINNLDKNNDESMTDGYRVYRDKNDLRQIFENPLQSAYSNIKNLFVFDADSNEPLNNSFRKINDKVQQNYFIVNRDNAVADKTIVLDNDTFVVTYSKQGYKDVKKTFRISNDDRYFSFDKRNIRLKSADEMNIMFKKEYRLYVKNKNTQKPLTCWEIVYNGTKYSSNGDSLIIELPDGNNKITIMSKGYNDLETYFNTTEPNKNIYFLEPREWSSGNIRLITPSIPEGKFGNATITANENSSIASYISDNLNNEKRTFYLSTEFTKKTPHWLFLVLFLVGIISGVFVGHFVWKVQEQEHKVQPPEQPVEKTDTSNTDTSSLTTTRVCNSLEEMDIDYLSTEEIWELDNLKSDTYKSFLTDELINNTSSIQEHTEINNQLWKELYKLKEMNKEKFKNNKEKFCDKDKKTIDLRKGIIILSPNNAKVDPMPRAIK